MSAPDPTSANANLPLLRLTNVQRHFGEAIAVDGVSIEISDGEFFALLGPSGCGKTTLLRMIAGFEGLDGGHIELAGRDISATPPHRRPVNMMFQSYALFPHLTVSGNIAFGLKREGMARDKIAERVAEMLRLGRLEGLGSRRPDQLSGGQRQRVALVRALAKRPRILLLDEPLAALDKGLRADTQFELMEIQKQLGMTFIIVTHDQNEAMTLATRIGVMNRGRLEQVAAPRDVYEQPANRYVAGFVGDINLFDGIVDTVGHFRTEHPAAVFRISEGQRTGRATLAVRPEKISLSSAGDGVGDNRLTGRITETAYLGHATSYRVMCNGTLIRVSRPNTENTRRVPFGIGDAVDLCFSADSGTVLDR